MNDEEMRRATAREWLAARIVLVGGFAIAIAVAAYFVLRPPAPVTNEEVSLPPASTTEQQAPVPQAEADRRAGMMICAQELIAAKRIGIVTGDAQLTSLQPHATAVKDRFACVAATTAEQYIIAADLRCSTLTDSRCVALHDIATHNGTIIYQRQQQ